MNATSRASALLTAMVVAGLLAASATLMLIETRAARASASDAYRFARAQAAVAKMLAIAEVRLDAGDPLPSQGLLFDQQAGRVLRQDASGLVDINAAPPERLAALFASLGASGDDAVSLGDAIADWRDSDSLRRLHGAEADDYRSAGLAAPGNRPFVVESELARVIGMRPDLLDCALPYLTVHAGADIDANSAPAELQQRLRLTAGPGASNAALGQVILLRAEAPLSAQARFQRTLWVRFTGDPERPLMIHRAAEGFVSPLPPTHCEGAR